MPVPTRTPLPTITTPPTSTPAATNTPLPIATPLPTATPAPILPPGAEAAQLVQVVDGDTIDVMIAGKPEAVRYIGIDTPERGQPGFGAAAEANLALLTPQLVLVPDVSERDDFGRLLRYVYSVDGAFINAELVRQGWAQPVEYSPDTRYAAEFRALAQEAAGAGRGFWSGSVSGGTMPYAIVTSPVANIRRGPDTSFEVSSQTTKGAPLTVFGRNRAFPEWCGLSFRRGQPVWNNSEPDAAVLVDSGGNVVARWE